MDVDVKVIETKTVTITLTEEEAKSLAALTVYFPSDDESEEYTVPMRDFKYHLYRKLNDNVSLGGLNRSTYIV